MSARDIYKKGERVRYSPHGIERLKPRYPNVNGVVVGFSRDPDCVRVRWGWRITDECLHVDFIMPTESACVPETALETMGRG